jgi:predicted ArsR family transcriptional regulator
VNEPTSEQLQVLRAIVTSDGEMTEEELAQRLGMTRNAVNKHLCSLLRATSATVDTETAANEHINESIR